MRQNNRDNFWIPGQGLFIGGTSFSNIGGARLPAQHQDLSQSSELYEDNEELAPKKIKCGYPQKYFKTQSQDFLNTLQCTRNPENIINLNAVQDPEGNLYCFDCFSNLKRRKQGSKLKYEYPPSKIIEALSQSIVVCLHSEQGCKFEGKYSEIEEHLKNECNFEMVECGDCHLFMTRPALFDHAQNCEFRKIDCQYCGEELIYKNIQSHENECKQFPVTCWCGQIVPKSLLVLHQQEQCELHYCKACNITIKKTELNEHYSSDIVKHLSMFGDIINEIEQLNTELEEDKALCLINCKVGNLQFGSQCHICLRTIAQYQPQYYCHTCHVWFCEECANQEKINKSGTEKLSHPHILVYINVVNTRNLGNIEPFKFGHNIDFKNEYNEIQKSFCNICEQESQYQKNRWLCMNCPVRPSQNKIGYKCFEMCDKCMETLKKRNPEDEAYKILYDKNKKKAHNQHNLDSHVYLRLKISHQYPEYY